MDMVEKVARAIEQAILSQSRSGATLSVHEDGTRIIGDDDSNSWWETLQVARAAIEAMGAQWRPIESAPYGTLVLLGWTDWRDGAWCTDVGYASHGGQRLPSGYINVSRHGSARYWQPLPAPPQEPKA